MEPSHPPHRSLWLPGMLALLLLGLAVWSVADSLQNSRRERAAALERQAGEQALILQGRLEAVLAGLQFAASRLRNEVVREPVFCQGFMDDLVASREAVVGGAVHDDAGHVVCSSGGAPGTTAGRPDTGHAGWRLQPEPDGGLRLDHWLAASDGSPSVTVALKLDAAALGQGVSPGLTLRWTPGPTPPPTAGDMAASLEREVRIEDQVVARLSARAAPATAQLDLRAVVAMLLACVALTALALLWLHRRRQRDDSQRLIDIARRPQDSDLLQPRLHDGDLAMAARVVVDEQRQLRAMGEELEQARYRLEEVQRAASMGSWRVDLSAGRIDWSDQAHEIFGVPVGEPFDLERLFALVHPEDRALLVDRQRALTAGEADMDVVHRIARPGGEERVVHARGTVAARGSDGRPTALVGTVQDVTEAWESSGLSDALARALALSAEPVLLTREHAGLWLWSWSNRAWDRLCEQLGIDGREADHQLFHPEVGLLRRHVDRVRQARAEGRLLRLDLELATPQGPRWFEAELTPPAGEPGRAGHGLLMLRDRSAERLAAQTLREANARLERMVGERTAALARSERQYRVLADLSPQILWQADPDGQVVYLNRAWHELVGPREGGWLGLRWMDALHPEDLATTRAAFDAALGRRRSWQVRRRVRSRSGEYRSFLGVAAPLLADDGSVQGWVGVEADITELEQHATRLQQLNAELETFSYTVSHDLRAPVHVVKGFVEALLAGQVGQVDAQARSYLERVLRSACRMDELIADLLALARLTRETLQPVRFDVGELAAGVLDALRERHPGRAIELRLPDGAPAIEADRRLFQVVLENLLDNAVKFSAGQPVCRIDIGWRLEHEAMVIELADNGVGFPPELAHRLFRPYQRLHAQSAFPGHGIGLATVARIVQLHGGAIAADNRPEGGAVFRIRLPRRIFVVLPDPAALPATETP